MTHADVLGVGCGHLIRAVDRRVEAGAVRSMTARKEKRKTARMRVTNGLDWSEETDGRIA